MYRLFALLTEWLSQKYPKYEVVTDCEFYVRRSCFSTEKQVFDFLDVLIKTEKELYDIFVIDYGRKEEGIEYWGSEHPNVSTKAIEFYTDFKIPR